MVLSPAAAPHKPRPTPMPQRERPTINDERRGKHGLHSTLKQSDGNGQYIAIPLTGNPESGEEKSSWWAETQEIPVVVCITWKEKEPDKHTLIYSQSLTITISH